MFILLAFQMTRAGFKQRWVEPRANLFKFTSSSSETDHRTVAYQKLWNTCFNEVSAPFPQVSWMWRCHVLSKSTPRWRNWSRPRLTWRRSYRTTRGTTPANRRLCPPPRSPPPIRPSLGPVCLARTRTVRPPPWVNPAASEPCRWPSTGSPFRAHRLWWWWRRKAIRSGPAWPCRCPPWWQTSMWSRDSGQKVSERPLDLIMEASVLLD